MPELQALYADLDDYLDQLGSAAAGHGDTPRAEIIERKQRLNDQAYFVLCWGQLETEIDTVCRAAIRRRTEDRNWTVRRAWDLYNPDDRRLSGLSFEERVALVLDRAAGAGSPWARVQYYYNLRNQIAHGTLRSERIDITAVVQEFYQIQAALAS